jgi:hypothetical protein
MSDLRTQKDAADCDLSDCCSGRLEFVDVFVDCLASGYQVTVTIVRTESLTTPPVHPTFQSDPIVPREEDRLYRFPYRLSRHHLVEVSTRSRIPV